MQENDLEMVEALVKSPAFAALVRVIEAQKQPLIAALVQSKDPDEVKQLQGRIQGMNMLANIPTLLTQQREKKRTATKKSQ